MLLGVIADDFTGASDIANALAKGLPGQGGLRTTQYLGIPDKPSTSDVEAGVISLKSRSIAANDAVDQSMRSLAWLRAQGCEQIVLKYCSTFDSTPNGNIGPVAEALAQELGVAGVVACPAYPSAYRTVYQGHLFVKDMLLSQSGMEKHPLNPMTDPDIRRWLASQSREDVGLVPWQVVTKGDRALREALDRAASAKQRLVIVDAISDQDLITIGRACRGAPLLTGGAGIAMALPANFIDASAASGSRPSFFGVGGPEAVLAGSCSAATLRQIEVHAERHPAMSVNIDELMSGELRFDDLLSFIRVNEGEKPLIYSSATPDIIRSLQDRYGSVKLASTLDDMFAEVARRLVGSGVKRLVVAGGETSGAVVSALRLGALAIGPEIDPGVPVLFGAEAGIALALKSGNFGSPEFFEKALNQFKVAAN